MRFLTPILLTLAAAPLQAAITYSGTQNLTITNTFEGLYVDFTNPLDASQFQDYTDVNEPANWDINLFFGGAAVGNSDTFLVSTDAEAVNSTLQNLSQTVVVGDTLGEGEIFVASFSGSSDHMGSEFTSGTPGYIGFKIFNGVDYYFGWMRLTLYDDGVTPGIVHDWAWETSGGSITVGAIPEPNALGMLAAGIGCLLLVRRRRA